MERRIAITMHTLSIFVFSFSITHLKSPKVLLFLVFILQNINLASSFIKQGTMDCLSVMSAAGHHILWAFITCTCFVWSWGGHLTCCQHSPAWRWQMGSNNHKYVFFSGNGPGVPKILTNTGISAFLVPISSLCYYIYFYFSF